MLEHLASLPRPRTLMHPGAFGAVRIDHMQAAKARHFRLSLPPCRSLFDAIVSGLAGVGVSSASMTLLGGSLERLSFCLAKPDASGKVVATYSAPENVLSSQFIFGNATLGQSATADPVVHCHAVFQTEAGSVYGGHLLTETAVVGASAVTVLATALDGFDLRIGYDEETRMPLLRPCLERPHV